MNRSFTNLWALCALAFMLLSLDASAQRYGKFLDLTDEHIEAMMPANDTALQARFLRQALELFRNGDSIPVETVFHIPDSVRGEFFGVEMMFSTETKTMDTCLYGVALNRYDDFKDKPELCLNKLTYRNFGRGGYSEHQGLEGYASSVLYEGLSHFWVTYNQESERQSIVGAIDSYLVENAVPENNAAYDWATGYKQKSGSMARVFRSDGISTIMIGSPKDYYGEPFCYLRRNGNLLIQICSNEVPKDVEVMEELDYERLPQYWKMVAIYVIDPAKPFSMLEN